MPFMELLPPDQTGSGYGSKAGLFPSDNILANIAPPGRIDGGEGIPSVWWEVWFAKWALADQKKPPFKPANELLRLFVLLQFLGLLKPKIPFSDHPGFQRLTRVLLEQDPAKERGPFHFRDAANNLGLVVLWTLQGDDRTVVAGSHPEMIFFPSAALTVEHVEGLKGRLTQQAGSLVEARLVTGDAADPFALQNPSFIRVPHFAKALENYLTRLVGPKPSSKSGEQSTAAATDSDAPAGLEWRKALTTWQKEFEDRTKSLALSMPIVPTGLRFERERIEFALWPDSRDGDRPEIWNCPKCVSGRWRMDRANQIGATQFGCAWAVLSNS